FHFSFREQSRLELLLEPRSRRGEEADSPRQIGHPPPPYQPPSDYSSASVGGYDHKNTLSVWLVGERAQGDFGGLRPYLAEAAKQETLCYRNQVTEKAAG